MRFPSYKKEMPLVFSRLTYDLPQMQDYPQVNISNIFPRNAV
jgi:hypothetical protein